MDPLHRVSLGKAGEDLACRELERQGYAILARRYRTRHGEIDIIARDGRTVVFVEVKSRASTRFGSAVDSVTLHKQARIAAMACDYVSRHGLRGVPCRFDVVAVSVDGRGGSAIEVIKSAFDAAIWY